MQAEKTKDKLNICLVSREYLPDTDWGGIGTYTYQLSHGLAECGHNVHVIAQSLDSDREYLDNKVYVHRISHQIFFPIKLNFNEFLFRVEYSIRLYQKLKEVIKKYNMDIIEAPNFFAEGFFYSLFKYTPLVIRLHTSFYEVINSYNWENTFDRKLGCFLEDASIMRSDLITCSTKICAQTMAKRLGMNAKKIEVVPLGIEMPTLDCSKPINNGSSDNAYEILFVGRLERRKGVHVLMRAIPFVLKELPQAHFTFIGRDTFVNSQMSSFEEQQTCSFKESLLKDFPEDYKTNINFLGYVEKETLSRYFRSCDIFVAPSLYETFGLVYVEAMSYGKPVIGCRIGGIPEVIKESETGLLVPPDDHLALANAIIQLLDDAQLRRKMGIKAREHVEKNFTRVLMAERTLDVYKTLLSKPR